MRKLFQGCIRLRDKLRDSRYNRKLIGYDRQGNSYYQYYDDDGNELRREVKGSTMHNVLDIEFDAYWDEWLRGKKKEPWTQEELEALWAKEDKRFEVGFNYEKNDAEMMKNFRNSTGWRGENHQYMNKSKAYAEYNQGKYYGDSKNINDSSKPDEPDYSGFMDDSVDTRKVKNEDVYDFGQGQEHQVWTQKNAPIGTGDETFAPQGWAPQSKRK